jgi:hypothetical protein
MTRPIAELQRDLDSAAISGGAYMSEQMNTVFCVYPKKYYYGSGSNIPQQPGQPGQPPGTRGGLQSPAPGAALEYETPESAIEFILKLFKSKVKDPKTDFDMNTSWPVCRNDTSAYVASNADVLKMLLDTAYELGIHSVPEIKGLAFTVLNINQFADVPENGEPQVTGNFKFGGTRDARFSIMPPSVVTRTIVIIILVPAAAEVKVTVTVKW